jgi:hypothetical protein
VWQNCKRTYLRYTKPRASKRTSSFGEAWQLYCRAPFCFPPVFLDPTGASARFLIKTHGFQRAVKTRCGLVLTALCAVLSIEHRYSDVKAEQMRLQRGGEDT